MNGFRDCAATVIIMQTGAFVGETVSNIDGSVCCSVFTSAVIVKSLGVFHGHSRGDDDWLVV